MSQQNEQYWKNKLFAFLHDPPSKALNIYQHEQLAKQFMKSAGFNEEDIKDLNKYPDHIAAAIDRFPFPKNKCTANFNGDMGNTFIHPFSGEQYTMYGLKGTD